MGGLISSFGEALERGATKLTSFMENKAAGRGVLDIAGNKEWELNLTPEGKVTKGFLDDYHRLRNQALKSSTDAVEAVKQWHGSNSQIRNTVDLKTAKINDLVQVSTGHPIQQTLSQVIQQDPENRLLNLENYHLKQRGQARLTALGQTFGLKMENFTPLYAQMIQHPDPRVNMNAQRLLQIVSNEIHDTKPGIEGGKVSGAAASVNATLRKYNNAVAKSGIGRQLPLANAESTYEPPTNIERVAHKILRTIQIPFVAVPHLGQYFHLPASAPILNGIGRALLQMDKQHMEATIEASGLLNSTQWDVIHSDLLARTGQVAKWTNSPTAASIIQKTIHTPLFSWMRLKQLSAAGSVGFHSAIYWGREAVKGDKLAILRLQEIGIDPAIVAARGGQLSEEELQKGVYHFVNNRFFFDKSIDNSLWQNRNIFMRSAMMYHSFVNSEVSYLKRELLLNLKSGNIKGIAQFAGTIGILFPAVAPMLKSAEILLRTGSPTQAGEGMKQDYENLSGANGILEAGSTYIEMLAHLGAAGAYLNYMNAIKGHRLANAVVGPMVGMGIADLEDSVNAARGQSAKPLGRDLTQLIPVIGKPLSHKLFPTTKEMKENSTSLKPKQSSLRRDLKKGL